MIFDSLDRKEMPSVFPETRHSFAICLVSEPRRISIIKSMTLQALIRPSWISFFAFSLASRVVYLRLVHSN